MTGFNLPPGCTYKMLDDAMGVDSGPCECCGEAPEQCFCPECPQCSEQGNPFCYADYHEQDRRNIPNHGLRFSARQLIGQTQQHILDLKSQIADAESYIEWLMEDAAGRKHR